MPFVLAILRGVMAFFARILAKGFGAVVSAIRRLSEVSLKGIWTTLKDGLKRILTQSINITGWLVLITEALKKLAGIIGIGSAVASGSLGVKQIFDFANAVLDPQEQMLDWLSEAFSHLPSLSGIIASLDSQLATLTQPYFTPPITFTYLLQVTGIGHCFNQYLQALISTLIFIFSIWLVKWAFTNNFTFTKSVPSGP